MRLFFAVFLHRHLKCWVWSSYAKRFRKYEESHLFPFCLFVCFFAKEAHLFLFCLSENRLSTQFHAPVLHICHDCFLHRHLKCWFRSSCIYAKRLLKNLRKIFVSLFFVCFFFPKYFIRVVSRMSNYPLSNSVTPELTTKIELTQRYEFNRQS